MRGRRDRAFVNGNRFDGMHDHGDNQSRIQQDSIHNEPTFAEFFISHLLVRSSQIQADLVDQLFNSSEKRLARALLLLANFGEEGEPEPLLAKISQETLADDDRHDASTCQFIHEQISPIGPD